MRIEFLVSTPGSTGAVTRTLELPMNQCSIGRENADLELPDVRVSRMHANLYFEGGRLTLRDLGSSNGTFHNNERVTEAYPQPGDVLKFGRTIVVLVSAFDHSTRNFYPAPERAPRPVEESEEPPTQVDEPSDNPRIRNLGLITHWAGKKIPGHARQGARPPKLPTIY